MIDEYMPTWEVRSRHACTVAAPADRVYAVVRSADFGALASVRLLMGLRSLPGLLRSPGDWWKRTFGPAPERRLMGSRFTLLSEVPGSEFLLGLRGRFWSPTGGLTAFDPRTFAAGPPPGLAQAAWLFRVEAEGSGTRLLTETRVCTGDARSARLFRRYWMLVGPFSGWLRRRMLAHVKRAATARPR